MLTSGTLVPWRWGADRASDRERGMREASVPVGGRGLDPYQAQREVLFCPWAHTICLSLLRKPAFPSYLPRGGASAGSHPWIELYFPAGLFPGQPVVHLYLDKQL